MKNFKVTKANTYHFLLRHLHSDIKNKTHIAKLILHCSMCENSFAMKRCLEWLFKLEMFTTKQVTFTNN